MSETTTAGDVPARLVTDISDAARSLARMADRLPRGRHIIYLEKPPVGRGWHIEIAAVTQVKETQP